MARLERATYDRVMAEGGGAGGGRSTAIVLFTDLVGSTELRSRLGEDAAEEVRRKHDELVTASIEANRGRLVKNLGDGVMATFAGASGALSTAVAIQQALDRHNRSGTSEVPLEVRIGISAGDVAFEKADCFGTPVIEAARLCAAADGGKILVTDVVRVLAGTAGGHQLTPVGALELKGLPAPLVACEVTWEPLPVSSVPFPALLTDVGRIFVGREGELERLGQLWKEAAAGERRVALLAGEPGVGKTRLTAELAFRAHADGSAVLAGRCDEDLGVPYQPFLEALRHFVKHTPAAELREGLGRHGGELVRLVPELTERLPELPAPLRSDPETERYRLFDAVAAWLASVSAEAPLLLVLDDLQWAAKPTLLLLRHVVRSSEAMRLLVVGTYRDTELDHDHPLLEVLADLRRQQGVERFSLVGLDQSGVADFVAQASGQALDDDALALARAIHLETEGNPFFVREVLRLLTETGAVVRHRDGWSTRLPIEELGIPEGVREVVGKRLARLSADANRVLRTAAVVGAEFEPELVRMADAFDEEALIAALEEATAARLVIESGSGRYRFAHALVRDALYDGLASVRRVALHRQVAESIESLYAGALDDHLPALAHHYTHVPPPPADVLKAVDYTRRAADRALVQLAHHEAVAYYRQALELVEMVDPNHPGRLGLLISLGEAQRWAGDPAYRETLLAASTLAQAQGDPAAMARAALANTRGTFSGVGIVDVERVAALEAALAVVEGDELRARLQANLAAELMWAGDLGRKRALGDEALAIARRLDQPLVLASVLAARTAAMWDPASAHERLEISAELLELSESTEDPRFRLLALWRRLNALMELGDVAGADAAHSELQRLATELRQPVFRWFAAKVSVSRLTLAGQLDEAEAAAATALSIAREAGQVDAEITHTVSVAGIRYAQGRLGEVVPLLADSATALPTLPLLRVLLALGHCQLGQRDDALEALAPLRRAPVEHTVFDYFAGPTAALWAEACAELGDTETAASLAEHITPHAVQMAYHPILWLGSFAHHLGRLATALGRPEEAEAHFATAVQTHERLQAPVSLGWTRLHWAHLLLARGGPGDAEAARELLGQTLATARELGLVNVERRAVALLA
jgi:class 3 adenylate cyclase/tetratricopeptide (TPR) repeat protein